MKKFFTSRGFMISALSVLCIAILGICWYAGRDKTGGFAPDDSPPSSLSSEWDENNTARDSKMADMETAERTQSVSPHPSTTAAETEEYPKVAEKTPEETVISFTPTKKAEETAPPAPEGKTILENPGPEHPINPAPKETTSAPETPAVTEPAATEPAPSQPAPTQPAPTEPPATEPAATHPAGAVYDPVFGWVVPSEVIQSTIISDGDPNKMVGNMN